MSPRTARALTLSPVARAVHEGLARTPKSLPPWLFYDDEGSRLFEEITRLPEYYLTRAESELFAAHGAELVRAAAGGRRLTVVELGAGTATKSQILLRETVRLQGKTVYMPVDVSAEPLRAARARLAVEEPEIVVRPLAVRHEDAMGFVRELPGRRLVLFIGSSIGNYDEDDAVSLLAMVRRALRPGDALLLGTDLRKRLDVLVPAYDDAAGTTAAFNKNVLARINRELGGEFDVDRFRHVAVWNGERSRIEMHLESLGDQRVAIADLDLEVVLRDGERIHTESSVKYDLPMTDRLVEAAGFRRERTVTDPEGRFAEHLARA